MKTKSTILFVTLLLASCFLMAQSCPTLLKEWNAGPCRAVVTSGDQIIYSSGAELYISELGEDQMLNPLYTSVMPGIVLDISVNGNLLAVACDFGGVQLMDITTANSPQKLALIQTSYQAFQLTQNGSLVYVMNKKLYGNSDTTLSIYDCSNPILPVIKGELQLTAYTKDIVVNGAYLYAAYLNGGLFIVDVSNPSNPILIDTVFEALGARDLTISNGMLYVAQGGHGVSVFDLSTPSTPQLIDYIDLTGSSELITSIEGYLYVGTEKNGIHVLDTADPPNPVYLSTVDAGGAVISLGANSSVLVTSSLTEGLEVYALSDPELPEYLSTISLPGEVLNVLKMNSLLLVNENPFGVRIYEISEDFDLTEIGLIPIENRFVMTQQDPYLFVCETGTGNLAIYDLSDSQNILQISSLNVGFVNAIETNGSSLFFSSSEGIKIVDITNPASPEALPTMPYPCLNLDVYESFLAIASGGSDLGIKIFEVSDPENPFLIMEWDIYYYNNVEIDDHYIYYGSGSSLNIADYRQSNSNKTGILQRSLYNRGDLSVDYPLAAISEYDYDRGYLLHIIPILNPEYYVTSIGKIPIKGTGGGCLIENNHVWVAQENAGLALYDLSNCLLLPDVDYSYQPDSRIMVRQMVQFSDQSANYPTGWHWDFGDGTTSEEANPIHFFQEPGEYEITLSASNIFGTASITKTLQVIENTEIPPISLQGTYTYILPSVGVGKGSQASYWSSMVQMYRATPVAGDVTVYLYYMEERGGTSTLESAELYFSTESLLRFDNILETVFGRQASRGALLFSSPSPLTIAASVINSTDEEGILAQRIPVLKPSDLLGCAEAGSIDFLFHDQPVRVNLGIINMSFQPLQIFIPQFFSLYLLEIPPLSYRQLDHMVQYTDGVLPRITIEAYGDENSEGGYFSFVSVIDNRNGNPIYFPIQQP